MVTVGLGAGGRQSKGLGKKQSKRLHQGAGRKQGEDNSDSTGISKHHCYLKFQSKDKGDHRQSLAEDLISKNHPKLKACRSPMV